VRVRAKKRPGEERPEAEAQGAQGAAAETRSPARAKRRQPIRCDDSFSYFQWAELACCLLGWRFRHLRVDASLEPESSVP